MKNYGFVKVATAIPTVKVADCKYNRQHLIDVNIMRGHPDEKKNSEYINILMYSTMRRLKN